MSQFENDYLALDTAMGQMKLDDLEESDFLEHYQIKGAKHGVRRFQNYDGSLTPAGRERYGVGAARTKKDSDDKAAKKATREEKAAERKAKREAEKPEKLKKYLRNHPEKIYKNRKKLTEEDLEELKKQIDFDHKCQDISYDERERTLKRIEQTNDYGKKISNLLATGIGLYNNGALVYNWFYDRQEQNGADMTGKHRLPQMTWNKSGGDSDKKQGNSGNQSSGNSGKKNNQSSGNTDKKGNTGNKQPVDNKKVSALPNSTKTAATVVADNASTPLSEVTKYSLANRYRLYGMSY